jgi:hypothetical protein
LVAQPRPAGVLLMEARTGFEPVYNELQSFAYPLGHRAI